MTHLSYSSRQSQQGATLIVVLMLLLMISVIGVIALKQSRTDLKLASSDQINTLLLQSSDSSVQKIEDIVNDKPGAPTTSESMIDNPTGALGHFIINKDTKQDVYTYCFNARTNYLATTATILREGAMTMVNKGSCLDGFKNFKTTTDMGVAITQVSIKPSVFKKDTEEPLSHKQIGQDTDDRSSTRNRFDIYATSAVPTYSDTDITDNYDDNFGRPEDLKQYLKDNNVPHITVFEQADVVEKMKKIKCIDYGKASFDSANCNN